jgi:hypothetical protein
MKPLFLPKIALLSLALGFAQSACLMELAPAEDTRPVAPRPTYVAPAPVATSAPPIVSPTLVDEARDAGPDAAADARAD